MPPSYKPVVLLICDGWGVAPASEGNAITRSVLPNISQAIRSYPVMTLHASGNEVGLVFGEVGYSEVGHLNIGAGRIYYQTLPRIDQDIAGGGFFSNQALLRAVQQVKERGSALHIIGLMSMGNVHASQEHAYALLKLCASKGLRSNVFVHPILDGRDTAFNAGKQCVENLLSEMKSCGVGTIASLSGRYYAMDRDNRWDRIEKAYRAIACGEAEKTAPDALSAIEASYAAEVYDEEFLPTVITHKGKPVATVKKGDAVIFFNFRPDRARELTEAFVLPAFNRFQREYIEDVAFITMAEYDKNLPAIPAYPPMVIHNCLAEVVSKAGLRQVHIAETEKYAHVTFFLNGTIETPFEGEERVLIPSPRVVSYAEQPQMSAAKVAEETIKRIDSGGYDLIVVNFANADMVGHTGNITAAIAGCEAIDKAFGVITEHTLAHNGVVIMTADHGNAEEMINFQTSQIDKEHSVSPVPLFIIGSDFEGQAGPGGDPIDGDLSVLPPVGVLADVAPTVLKLMGIEQPPEMTGQPLI
jgi:2,3-bisphosphoglycerate-independent phosphoglycerate mutase